MSRVHSTKVKTTTKSYYQADGTMVIIPEEFKATGDKFSFNNFYCEYGRFHMDDT
jgi:hypothetical protein